MRLLTATVALLLFLQAAALAGAEWRSLTGGVGWGPCATVTFAPDTAHPASAELQADLSSAAARINRAVGRELVRVAAGGAADRVNGSDGINSVLLDDLGGGTPGRVVVSGYASVTWTSQRIIDADIVMNASAYAEAPADLRISVVTHELAHALGLDHVGDAHEVMSYAFIDDGDGIGAGTTSALRALYTGPCDADPRLEGSHGWQLPDHGDTPPRARLVEVGSHADSLQTLSSTLGAELGSLLGGPRWATHAVVCRADAFPDCLAGAALAGPDAPLLLVPGGPDGRITPDHPAYRLLADALPASGTVYVLGGRSAVSDAVVATLAARWPDTRRLAGPSRVETAAAVAREVVSRWGRRGVALIARSDNPADAVTGGAFAAARGVPVLLTGHDRLHPAAAAVLAELGIDRTYVLGGPAAIGGAPVDALHAAGRDPVRVAGRTRSETAVAIARDLWGRTAIDRETAFVALPGWHEDTWALALTAAPLAAQRNAPILLTEADGVPNAPPADGYPGDTAWYLAHLTHAPGVSGAVVDVLYVGKGRWAGSHAAASLPRYVGLS